MISRHAYFKQKLSILFHSMEMLLLFRHLLILTIDPALGRLDYHSLSDQMLMEMLIDGMLEEYKKNFQDSRGNFIDVCEWKSNETLTPCVRCTDGRVRRVELSNITFAEIQFPFHFIPPLAEQFIVMNCNIHGTLETSHIPNDMLSFHVKYSCLYGSIHWGSFPRKLKFLQIGKNALSGSIILTDLPDALITLAAESNKFGGGIDLHHLPKGMKVLEL